VHKVILEARAKGQRPDELQSQPHAMLGQDRRDAPQPRRGQRPVSAKVQRVRTRHHPGDATRAAQRSGQTHIIGQLGQALLERPVIVIRVPSRAQPKRAGAQAGLGEPGLGCFQRLRLNHATEKA